ncbi:MAG: YqgE/AlgH family protein [Holosporaceae bacterium]|jgi:putative transcriptional regulator|nr:YqgE/AlgH family protein [Holosporaceae bacterium]
MSNEDNNIRNLTGKILFSTSSGSSEYLNKSMIYLCSHDRNGAMGIIINKLIPDMTVCNVLKKMKISTKGVENLNILFGGIEESDRCFILHSDDYMSSHSTIIHDRVALTINGDILNVITSSKGPEKKLLCMGCCIWDMDQLENEVASSYWIPIEPDEALLFGNPKMDKWGKAWMKIGSKTNVFLDLQGNA